MKLPSSISYTGLILGSLYALGAGYFIYDAMTCLGMLCDLLGFILACPAFAILWGGYKILDAIFVFGIFDVEVQDHLLLPSYLINIVLFYFFGKLCVWIALKFLKRNK